MPKAACLTCTALARLDLCACNFYLYAAFCVEVLKVFVIRACRYCKNKILLHGRGKVLAASLEYSHGAVIAWSAIGLFVFFHIGTNELSGVMSCLVSSVIATFRAKVKQHTTAMVSSVESLFYLSRLSVVSWVMDFNIVRIFLGINAF